MVMITGFYHGGPPGLTDLLPPSVTGAESSAKSGNYMVRADRVYVTTSLMAAEMYAALSPSMRGVVYEVEPIGVLEHDPDCDTPGLSFQCERARVIQARALKKKRRVKILRALGLEHP